jgi:hypothetical protein
MCINVCVIYNLSLLILCMWYLSNAFKCFPFFPVFVVLVTLPYAYPVLDMWFEYPELLLLFLIARICSLHLVCKVRPVCPTYFSGQSMHFIW